MEAVDATDAGEFAPASKSFSMDFLRRSRETQEQRGGSSMPPTGPGFGEEDRNHYWKTHILLPHGTENFSPREGRQILGSPRHT